MDTNIIEVRAGDRIDTIAYRVYGDPNKYDRVIELNPYLDIWNPKPGTLIKI